MMRIIQTRGSNWKFDTEKRMFVRLRRNEAPPWTSVPYTEEWEPYVAVVPTDDRVMVFRPVPWGQGTLRKSDVIISDSHEGEPWDVPDEEHLLQLVEPALNVYRDMVRV